jgi:hypothetical protein
MEETTTFGEQFDKNLDEHGAAATVITYAAAGALLGIAVTKAVRGVNSVVRRRQVRKNLSTKVPVAFIDATCVG